jgi:hypothetical protein
MYTDAAYAQGRLVETTLLHHGLATIIHKVNVAPRGKLKLLGVELRSGREISDYIDNFDYEPPPLGFSNIPHHGMAAYWMRKPMRKDWKQGLRSHNVYEGTGTGIRFAPDKALDVLENAYPTLDECIEMNERAIKKGFHNPFSAFTRHFAIHSDMKLRYKTYGVVGQLDADGNYLINPGFEWIEEALQETLKGIVK